jgi:hypothetical protein
MNYHKIVVSWLTYFEKMPIKTGNIVIDRSNLLSIFGI